jgi:hypothetical protein
VGLRRRARVSGAAWLLAAVGAWPGAAQQNLGFESVDAAGMPAGWSAFGPDDAAAASARVDDGVAVAGARSLRIERRSGVGATRLAQRLRGGDLGKLVSGAGSARRIRLSGALQAEGAAASLWLRVAGARGVLYVDSQGEGQERDDALPASGAAVGASGRGWGRVTLELPLPDDTEEIAYGVALRGAGAAWFDELQVAVTDTARQPPPSAAARRYVESALALVQQHALATPAVGWEALRRATLEHARGAVAPGDAHLAIRYALRELGDRHSYLQSPRAAGTLRSAAVANARTGQAVVPPWGALLEGRVGYVGVPGFAGGAALQQVEFAENIKKIIQQYDSTDNCGWVLDLRRNTGGNLWPMLAGVGSLLGDGEVAASVYPDGRRVTVWHRDGQAGFGDYVQLRVNASYRLRAAAPPVAVLLGPATASSGEVLAAAFRGRPRSRSFGAPTRGLSAGNRTFPLADGAMLVLTVAATSDRTGRTYAGPIEPDERVPAATTADGDGATADQAMAAALAWLRTQAPCSAAIR